MRSTERCLRVFSGEVWEANGYVPECAREAGKSERHQKKRCGIARSKRSQAEAHGSQVD